MDKHIGQVESLVRLERQEMLGILYDIEDPDVRLQIDAEVCAIQALSVVS